MSDFIDERRKLRRAKIEARLARVRGALTDAEFERLANAVMRTAERFTDIDAGPGRTGVTGRPGVNRNREVASQAPRRDVLRRSATPSLSRSLTCVTCTRRVPTQPAGVDLVEPMRGRYHVVDEAGEVVRRHRSPDPLETGREGCAKRVSRVRQRRR